MADLYVLGANFTLAVWKAVEAPKCEDEFNIGSNYERLDNARRCAKEYREALNEYMATFGNTLKLDNEYLRAVNIESAIEDYFDKLSKDLKDTLKLVEHANRAAIV